METTTTAKSKTRWGWILFVVLVLVLVVLYIAPFIFREKVYFMPVKSHSGYTPADDEIPFENCFFSSELESYKNGTRTEQERLRKSGIVCGEGGHFPLQKTNNKTTYYHAWLMKNAKKRKRDTKVVLFCHGNYGNMSFFGGFYPHTWNLDLHSVSTDDAPGDHHVFAFDYAGYGKSQGRPVIKDFLQSCRAAHGALLAMGYREENIIPYGFSIGSCAASYIASISEGKIEKVVLLAPFYAVRELFPTVYSPMKWFERHLDTNAYLNKWMTDKKKNNNSKRENSADILIGYSPKDEIIPAWHAKKLCDNINNLHPNSCVLTSLRGCHNTLQINGDLVSIVKKVVAGNGM